MLGALYLHRWHGSMPPKPSLHPFSRPTRSTNPLPRGKKVGAGLCVGRDSGDPYVDLEREAQAMLARDRRKERSLPVQQP